MKRLLIINPKSKNGKAEKAFLKIEPTLRENLGDFDVYRTKAPKDCTSRVRTCLLHKQYDQILIAGGDGSVNEATNGYFDEGKLIDTNIPFGVINLGTGGDFIKTLHIESPDYMQALKENRFTKVNCGITHYEEGKSPQYFMNISSVGLGGDVNKSLKSSNLQRWGTLAFFYSSIKMLIKYTPPACTLRIRKTGEENWTEVNTSLINFFVCNAQFSGGGMHWAPNASLTADNFEIVHVKAISKWRLFFESHKVYSGNVSQMSGVTLYQGSEIQVIPEGYSTQELDGEIRDIEEGHIPKEFNYRLIPKAIPVNL